MVDGCETPTTAATSLRHDETPRAEDDTEKNSAFAPTIAPPDGGREAWLTVIGAWMVQFCTFGYINAFGVYQDYYTREFLTTKSPSDISWIGSFQLFMQYAPGVLVGRAFDAGYFHHIMISGSLIYAFAMFMLSLVQSEQYYQVFLSQAVGMGIGQGMLFLPSLSIIGHHFKRRRALATGIVVTGASAGGIIFPILLNTLFPRVGFASSVRVGAGLVSCLLFIANCIMRTRLPPKSRRPPLPLANAKEILTDGAYMWSIAGAFFINLGLFFPFFYLQLLAVKRGINNQVAWYSLAILNAGSIAGRLLPTFLADIAGVYNMLIPSAFASAIFLFGLFGVYSSAGVVVIGLLHGFSSGAYVSLIPSLLGQLSTHLGELGIRLGFAFTVVGVAMLIGTPVEGALLGDQLSWWKAIVFCGGCASLGTAFMAVSRTLFAKRKCSQRV